MDLCKRGRYVRRQPSPQLIKAMKLTAVLLTMTFLHVAAKGTSQTVTFSGNQVSLQQIFDEITRQTGYTVFCNYDLLQKARPASVSLKNASIETAMSEALKEQPLIWTIIEKTIVVKPKQPAQAPLINIHGKVVNEDGDPEEAVSVKLQGSDFGTTTDANGEFRLSNIDGNAILIFSGINIEEVVQGIGNKTELTVSVKTRVSSLRDVVVNKGYYTVRQRQNTGSVSTVKSEDIAKQPTGDPIATLQGRVPGLQILPVNGLPGKASTILIRGRNSVAGGTNPLFIIDGMPFYGFPNGLTSLDNPSIPSASGGGASNPFNSLNPSDIESIEVLKDADATSIYGSRGANGVIIITTKKGKAGRTRIDFNGYSGFGKAVRLPQLMNTAQYLEMRHEAFRNDGVTTIPSNAYDLNGTWDSTRYTDWNKVIAGGTAHYTDGQISLSGGNNNTQFLIGAGYHKETTVYPGDFDDARVSVHMNVSHSSSNGKLKANISALYSEDVNKLPQQYGINFTSLPPVAPPLYDSFGRLNWQNSTWTNPFRYLYQTSKGVTDYLNSNLAVSYEPLPGFQLKSSFGYTTTQLKQVQLTPKNGYYNPAQTNAQATSSFGINNVKIWNIEPQLSYTKTISKAAISILAGGSFLQQTQESSAVTGTGFPSDALIENISAASTITYNGNASAIYKYSALFGRFNISWDGNKYLLNLTARRDGSSRFGPGRQFANFGAIGAGWTFTDEPFLKKALHFLNYGKLRASYGITGNDQIGDYQYLNLYAPFPDINYLGIATLYPTGLSNPDYAWERNRKMDIGLELGFFKDRLSITVDYYNNRASNQLVSYPLTAVTGGNGITANIPAVISNTGFEFDINALNVKTKKFAWSSSFNLTIPVNYAKLVSYPGLENSSYANSYIVGKSLSITKKLSYTGVDPHTGLYTFYDVDKDGVISFPNDYQTVIFTGQQFYGGLKNNFRYNGIELDIFFQYVSRKYVPNPAVLKGGGTAGTMNNQPIYVYDHRWQKEGDVASVQRFSNSGGNGVNTAGNNYISSDGVYENGSFVRLRNVSLSYQFPAKFIQKVHLQNFRIYMQAQNLFVITKFKVFDPETGSGSLGPLRVVTFGLQLGL